MGYPVEFILSLIGYLHTLKWAEKEEVKRGGGEREREKELTSHLRVCGVETGWPFDFIRFLEFRFDYGLEIRKLESGFLHQGPTGTTNSTKKRKKERKKEGKKERKREKSHPMNSH